MKHSFHKKLNQAGILSLHTIIPVILAVAAIGGIGAYVLTKVRQPHHLAKQWVMGTICLPVITRRGE